MSSQRGLALSYTRFSDPAKQSKGDSQGRQDRMFRDFCTRHNLTPLAEVFADKGRSGYHDEHRKKGRFGQLLAMAKDEAFEPGTVVVVEAWDRLGRLRPDKQTELLAELLRTGVHIGVCRLDDIFTEEDFGTHKWTTLAVFIQLAYQESKQKAERIGASWESRRQKAREKGTPVTGRVPNWLELVDGTFRPIPEAVVAVQRIFALAAQGYGRTRLIAQLIKEGVPPFGDSGEWTRPYVNRILTDSRVTGTYQPRRTDDTPDGPPITDYYPRIISDEEWLLARAAQEGRGRKDRKGRAVVRVESKNINLFRGLLTHARDGKGFFLSRQITEGKSHLVLRTASGSNGKGVNYTFPYPVFEEAVLKLLREVKPVDVLPRKSQRASEVDVLKARLANVRQDLAALQAELREKFSKRLAEVLRQKEEEEEQAAQQLQDALARTVRPAERAWDELPGLADLAAAGGEEQCFALRQALRRVIEQAWVLIVRRGSYHLCALQVYFAGGTDARRDYLIVRQAPGGNRRGGWWARSLAKVVSPGDLDLRQPEHARRLEAVLQTFDIETDG
jgi:DNA invertase Pin-like site-specific DNA recombinase